MDMNLQALQIYLMMQLALPAGEDTKACTDILDKCHYVENLMLLAGSFEKELDIAISSCQSYERSLNCMLDSASIACAQVHSHGRPIYELACVKVEDAFKQLHCISERANKKCVQRRQHDFSAFLAKSMELKPLSAQGQLELCCMAYHNCVEKEAQDLCGGRAVLFDKKMLLKTFQGLYMFECGDDLSCEKTDGQKRTVAAAPTAAATSIYCSWRLTTVFVVVALLTA